MTSRARARFSMGNVSLRKQVEPAEDGRQRRAQLVAHRGQELVLEAVGVLRLGARGLLVLQQLGALLFGSLLRAKITRDSGQ